MSYNSITNETELDAENFILVNVSYPNPLHINNSQQIEGRPIENGDIKDNTIQLIKLSSASYSALNTPSTLVQRNASGNFAAGNITAGGITLNGSITVSADGTYSIGTAPDRILSVFAINYFGQIATASQPTISTVSPLSLNSGTHLSPSNNNFDIGANLNRWRNIWVGTNLTTPLLTMEGNIISFNIVPSADNTRDIGTSINRYANGYYVLLHSSQLNTDAILSNGSIKVTTDDLFDIGTNAERFKNIYSHNLITNTLSATSLSSVQFIGANGSAGAPTFRMEDSDTGIWAASNGQIDFTTNGSNRVTISDTGLNVVSGNITGTLNTPAQPNITSLGTLTGLTIAGTTTTRAIQPDIHNVRAIGLDAVRYIAGYFINCYANFGLYGAGAAGTPSYTFQSDTASGMFLQSSSNLGFSAGGTRRLLLSTALATLDLPLLVNNGATKSEITSSSFGNGRLILDETSATQNPGIEIHGNNVFKGGMFFNSSVTERIELWGASNRFAFYTDSSGQFETEKIFRVSTNEFTPTTNGVWLKGGATSGTQNASIELRGGGSPYIDWVRNTDTIDFRTRLIQNSDSIMTLENSSGNQIFNVAGQVRVSSGAVGSPTFSFHADQDTGLYNPAANQLAITTNGTQRINVTTTEITSTLPILIPDGSESGPSLGFSGDSDCGLYRSGVNEVGLTLNGSYTVKFLTTKTYIRNQISVGTDDDNFIKSSIDNDIEFGTNNTERMRLRQDCLLINRTAPISGSYKNKLEVNGDVHFVTSKGQILWNTAETTTITTNNTYVQIVGSDSNFTEGNCAYNSNALEISSQGVYMVYYSMTFYSTAGFITKIAVFLDGTLVDESVTEEFHASVAGSSAPRTLAKNYMYNNANDTTKSLTIRCTCSAGATQNIVVTIGTFGLFKI
jgi:hypothetical protein